MSPHPWSSEYQLGVAHRVAEELRVILSAPFRPLPLPSPLPPLPAAVPSFIITDCRAAYVYLALTGIAINIEREPSRRRRRQGAGRSGAAPVVMAAPATSLFMTRSRSAANPLTALVAAARPVTAHDRPVPTRAG